MTEDMFFCGLFTFLAVCLWQVVIPSARERRKNVYEEVPAGELADVQFAISYLMFFASVGFAVYAFVQVIKGIL